MSSYFLLLGNTPQLSLAELKALAPDKEPSLISKHLAKIDLEDDQQAQQLQEILGGTFKIIKPVLSLSYQYQAALDEITAYLKNKDEKVEFGLTALEQTELEIEAKEVKKQLKKDGVKSRFRRGSTWGLSAAILQHETKTIDLFIIKKQDKFLLTETTAFQDLDGWIARDRNKPYTAARKGMLPPKLARIMVNLGLGSLENQTETVTLYDPFCGTGTVLIEALLRGCQVVGSDIDEDAAAGTLQNLYWLEKQYPQQFSYQVFQVDTAHADKRDWQTRPDLIVTEPFLGKPNPKEKELKNIFTGLESLYLGAFKTWTKIIKDQAAVCIVLPKVETSGKTYDLLDLIDKLQDYGYTLCVEPIDYGYEKAIVQRQILVFKYQKI